MAKSTVKCISCNIVICEVLSYIQYKHDVMDNESLIKICDSAFSEAEISDAKTLLFESVQSNQRKVSRRKDGKKKRNIEDIICFFKEVDPDCIPIFVARDLQKLPPISVDHIDVVTLLKDITQMRNDVNNIKEDYATVKQVQELQIEIENMKLTSIVNHNVNTRKRGACLFESGPIGLSPSINKNIEGEKSSAARAVNTRNDDLKKTSCSLLSEDSDITNDTVSVFRSPAEDSQLRTRAHEDLRLRTTGPRVVPTVPERSRAHLTCVPSGGVSGSADVRQHIVNNEHPRVEENFKSQHARMADVVRKGEWKNNGPSEEWKKVQRNRFRNRFIGKTGKAITEPAMNFKAAETKIPLFISNVDKGSTEQDICNYIKQKTSETVTLEKVKMKIKKPYSAYKIFVTKHKLDMYLNDELWPDGIQFRRFVHVKYRSPVPKDRPGMESTMKNLSSYE